MSNYCRDCIHDEMCYLTHCSLSVACCDFVNAERYHEIMHAEREGRLVILPCKRGTPVWRIVWEQVTWPDESRRKIIASNFRLDDIYEIGKTVFLTREEAEKALEEANG